MPEFNFDFTKVREQMFLQGLTRTTLSEKSGVSIPWISQVLRGYRPTPETAKKIVDAVGLTMQDILKVSKGKTK